MPINYEYYRIFYHVAKYQNFTKAAAVLLSNQPNVTRAMNHLEDELQCRLFVRSNRGVRLTPEGERLYEHVAIALRHLEDGEAELRRSASLHEGSISIGATETALHYYLLRKLHDFHETYPKVRLKITNCSTSHAIKLLQSGEIDLAAITSTAPVPPPLVQTRLTSFSDILIGSAHMKEKLLTLADLADYPLICLDKTTQTYQFYSQFFLEYGLELRPDIEVAAVDLILPMVQSDLGIALIPEVFARGALERGEIVQLRLKETLPQRHICLVWDRTRSLGAAVQQMKKMLIPC